MLKLISALLHKADDISAQLSDELTQLQSHASTSVHADEEGGLSRAGVAYHESHHIGLNCRVVRGLLSWVTVESATFGMRHQPDTTSEDGRRPILEAGIQPPQSQYPELVPALSDLQQIYPRDADLKRDRRAAHVYLSALSIGQATRVLLMIESLVMRSGRGHLFECWRDQWRARVYAWLEQTERERAARSALAALTPLSSEQEDLWAHYHEEVELHVQEVYHQLSVYFRDESALRPQLVLSVHGALAGHLSRRPELDVPPATLRHTHVFTVTSLLHRALSSISGAIRALLSLREMDLSSLKGFAPLLSSLLTGEASRERYQQTPRESRRAWLSQELRGLWSGVSRDVTVIFWLDHAERLSAPEQTLWAELLAGARASGIAVGLVALHRGKRQRPEQKSSWDHVLAQRGVSAEAYSPQRHAYSKTVTEWEQLWARELMWSLRWVMGDTFEDSGEIKTLWSEGLSALSVHHQRALLNMVASGARHQAELLSAPSETQVQATLPAAARLERAGWLATRGGSLYARSELLEELLIEYLKEDLTPQFLSTEVSPLEIPIVQPANLLASHSVIQRLWTRTISLSDHLSQVPDELLAEAEHLPPQHPLRGLYSTLSWFGLTSAPEGENPQELDEEASSTLQMYEWGQRSLKRAYLIGLHDPASDAHLISAQEVASAVSDLQVLAGVMEARAESAQSRGALLDALRHMGRAHQLWLMFQGYQDAQRVRFKLISLLADLGAHTLARALLYHEERALPDAQAKTPPYRPCGIDEIELARAHAAATVSAHLGDWLTTLSGAHVQWFTREGREESSASDHSYALESLKALYALAALRIITSSESLSVRVPYDEEPRQPISSGEYQEVTEEIGLDAQQVLERSLEVSREMSTAAVHPELGMLMVWVAAYSSTLLGTLDEEHTSELRRRLDQYSDTELGLSARGLIYRSLASSVLEIGDDEDAREQIDIMSHRAEAARVWMRDERAGLCDQLLRDSETIQSWLRPDLGEAHRKALLRLATSITPKELSCWEDIFDLR